MFGQATKEPSKEPSKDASKEPKKADAKKVDAEERKVGSFKRGDHMVHVLLQTGRKFISISNEK